MNPDNTKKWMSAITIVNPLARKSLSVDELEQYVYFATSTNPLNVWRLFANNGGISDAQT